MHHVVLCFSNIRCYAKWGNYATETHEVIQTAYRGNGVFKAQTFDGLSIFKGHR